MTCKECKYANPIDDHNPDSDIWCNVKSMHYDRNHECNSNAPVVTKYGSTDASNNIRYNSAAENYERGFAQGYEKGKEDTILKACEALYGLSNELNCDLLNIDKAKEYMIKQLE